MRRIAYIALASLLVTGTASAQRDSVPPASPTYGASGGIAGGIALPLGDLAKTNAAGYSLLGLVDFSAADQPFSFRMELAYQRYDADVAVAGSKNMNLISLGGTLLARKPRGASSAYASGGIAVYRATGRGTKPGVNIGGGLDVPLTYFVGMAELRIHYVMTDKKPIVTIPITLGARF